MSFTIDLTINGLTKAIREILEDENFAEDFALDPYGVKSALDKIAEIYGKAQFSLEAIEWFQKQFPEDERKFKEAVKDSQRALRIYTYLKIAVKIEYQLVAEVWDHYMTGERCMMLKKFASIDKIREDFLVRLQSKIQYIEMKLKSVRRNV